jgi:hypothetical protein
MLWDLALATGLSPREFETAEDILTAIEILESKNGQ